VIADRYTLEREIGRGGMGAVWLAQDVILGRHVALKRVGMFPGGSSPDLVRAEREAKLAAKLNHPHVVAVFDFLTDGDAQWLVMEYVEGVTLAELSKKRRGLPPDEAAPLIRQAAEALAAAHKAGIVHRDVKPSNIMVTRDGTAKLTDFGIARARADATLTQTGMVTGSPAYLAPEVASGQTATDASDVWSLGATMYHALTGRPPYDVGDNVVGALYKIVHEEPPRLPDAGRLGLLLESTMATDPRQRWSMAKVRDFLDGADVKPVAPATPASIRRREAEPTKVIAPNPMAPPPRRRSPLPWVAALLVLVVIAAGAWLLTRDNGQTPARNSPGSPTQSATSSSPTSTGATAAGMTSFVEDYLRTVADDPGAAWDSLTPAFQRRSGGFRAYNNFWEPVDRVRATDIVADPESLVVSYEVRYQGKKLKDHGGHVELRLAFEDGRYLIDGEPSRR
jgi:serine/threonine protein kinase